jgi:hypothetical protein
MPDVAAWSGARAGAFPFVVGAAFYAGATTSVP